MNNNSDENKDSMIVNPSLNTDTNDSMQIPSEVTETPPAVDYQSMPPPEPTFTNSPTAEPNSMSPAPTETNSMSPAPIDTNYSPSNSSKDYTSPDYTIPDTVFNPSNSSKPIKKYTKRKKHHNVSQVKLINKMIEQMQLLKEEIKHLKKVCYKEKTKKKKNKKTKRRKIIRELESM